LNALRKGDSSLSQTGAIAQAMNRIIVLPPDLFPVPSALVQQDPRPAEDAAKARSATAQLGTDLNSRVAALNEAIDAVNNIRALNDFPLEASELLSLPSGMSRGTTSEAKRVGTDAIKGSPALQAIAKLPPSPVDPVLNPLSVQPLSVRPLSPSVQSVLADLKLDIATTSLSVISERLNIELLNTKNNLEMFLAPTRPILLEPDPFHEDSPRQEWWDFPARFPTPPYAPNPGVKPAGIADLLVVREHVLRYEPGEIAFVENVAQGESFKRQTQRKNTIENSTLTTTFSGSETERDLQSTDRFNLQRQSQSSIEEKTDRVPGVGSSDAYGPLVDSGGSIKQSSSQASDFGQDITRRAVSKLTQALQTQVFQQTITEFDENVEHDFDNSNTGATDKIVVYQWLDKIVQAKVFSYGNRVLYDFIVPEPAAFLVYGMRQWQPELAVLQKPTIFSLQPDKLSTNPKDPNYYQYWATGYGATGIQPPPEPVITIAKTYANRAPNPFGDKPEETMVVEVAKEDISIDDGYQAKSAVVNVRSEVWKGTTCWVYINIGQRQQWVSNEPDFNIGFLESKPLNDEVGQIPLTIIADGASTYTVAVEITCVPTAQKIAQWQIQTHDAILQASHDRLTEYEDRVNTLQASLQVKIAGKSPDEKRALVRAELEKSCVSILSNQHFDAFNAIEFSPFGADAIPQLFLPNVEPMGRYIRFFQQAFEWEQMLYLYYPYFWGRKKYWNDHLQLDDADPEFAAFLGAGAARVTLPVRKNYERAVAAFMTTGKIPSEADLLSITTGLYVPFFTEMMGDDGPPDAAVPYGDPPLEWEIRVPTTLVKIRTDNTLPKWNKDTWLADNPGDPVTP
jgi:hypothetical protein